MMALTTVLCATAAGILLGVVASYASIGPLWAFAASWLVAILGGAALQAKQRAVTQGTATFAKRAGATFLTLLLLGPAVEPFVKAWKESEGFWQVAVLSLLALLGFMVLWVAYGGGEHTGSGSLEPPSP